VQFSRIQLSRRRYPLSGDGRDQRDKINKPELAVELAEWQRSPATAAPLAEPVRPNSPHQPAVELVEELSDVSPLVVVAPTTHDGVDLFYQLLSAHRSVPPREPAYLIPEVTDRFPGGNAYSAPGRARVRILLGGSRIGLPPRLILYPRNSKPCRTWTTRVFCGLMFTPSSFKTRLAASSATRAAVADVQVMTQSPRTL